MSVSRLVGGGSCPRQEQICDRATSFRRSSWRTRPPTVLDWTEPSANSPLRMPLPGARQPRPAGSGSAAAKQISAGWPTIAGCDPCFRLIQGRGMAGKSPVTATDEQMVALKVMAGGADRAEADRARAILLTLAAGPALGSPKLSACAKIQCACGVANSCAAGSTRSERALRGSASGDRTAAFCPGRGPTKLDLGPPCRGDSKPRGRHDLPIAALQGAAKKGGLLPPTAGT